MDYKAKLQTNNTELANNNIDLQDILNTINTLPEAGGSTVVLDEEIATQDTLIAHIQAELVGKVNPPATSIDTCTVNFINDALTYSGAVIEFIFTSEVDGMINSISTGEIKGKSSYQGSAVCGSVALVRWVSGGTFDSYSLSVGDTIETITDEDYHYFIIPHVKSIDITYGIY